MTEPSEPTDDEVRAKLRDTLKDTDLATTTEKSLRAQLEKHYSCSLKPRKALFKEEIEAFLATCEADGEADEPSDEEPPSTSKRRGGFAAPQTLSEELRAFLGVDESEGLSRGEVVKRIWAYIREHDLQDPSNRRKILADDKMETIFNFPLNMFSMNKQLSRHIKATSNVVGQGGASAPKKARKRKAPADDDDGDADAAPKKKGGFQQPQKLSPELAALLGVATASRPEVTKLLWGYFKEHELQDPEDKRNILVAKDAALYAIVGVDKCQGFSMMKHLKPHFLGAAEKVEDANEAGEAEDAE